MFHVKNLSFNHIDFLHHNTNVLLIHSIIEKIYFL